MARKAIKKTDTQDEYTLPLFESAEMDSTGKAPRTDLVLVGRASRPLTKDQKTFNRLTKRIEELRRSIRETTDRLDTILGLFHASIPGLHVTFAQKQLQLARLLGTSTETVKFGKRQMESIRDCIIGFCDDVFAVIEPDDDTITFYEHWSETSYREELEQEKKEFKDLFANGFREMFGIEMDMDFDDTPEGYMRFGQNLREELEKKAQAENHQQSSRAKTKKQLEREALELQRETGKAKSLRSIYLSLAKALHPDTAFDQKEIERKEELMKRVTAAYQKNDLPALLSLEMQWVASERDHLERLPEETLKGYIVALKEQVAVLEEERSFILFNPKYTDIERWSYLPVRDAKERITAVEEDIAFRISIVEDIIADCSAPNPKKAILECVYGYLDATDSG